MCLNLAWAFNELKRLNLFNFEILRWIFGLQRENDKGGMEEER